MIYVKLNIHSSRLLLKLKIQTKSLASIGMPNIEIWSIKNFLFSMIFLFCKNVPECNSFISVYNWILWIYHCVFKTGFLLYEELPYDLLLIVFLHFLSFPFPSILLSWFPSLVIFSDHRGLPIWISMLSNLDPALMKLIPEME